MRALFFSDLHLSDPKEPRYRLFIQLLSDLEENPPSHIFFLGDIFDLWLANHQLFIDRHADVLKHWQALQRKGVQIHYFEGNHDLYLTEYFEGVMGLKVFRDPLRVRLGKYDLLLEHGDLSDPGDRDYLALKWLLRRSLVEFLAKKLPGWAVAAIGSRAASASRKYTSGFNKNFDEIIQRLSLHAHKLYQLEPFDFIINGHVHVRADIKISATAARAINLGSWMGEPGYFQLTEDRGEWISVC